VIALDNHCHIDPRNGDGIDAVRRFARSGGTHMCIVNKPSWSLGVEASDDDDFREVFDETLRTVEEADEVLEGNAFAVLGVHPALVSKLLGRFGGPQNDEAVERAEEVMKTGLEVAAEYIEEGDAVALKSGRPHYDVQEPTWELSNNVMEHAFRLGADYDCAVQLHTESGEEFTDIRETAEGVGMPPDRVVKHFSSPDVSAVRVRSYPTRKTSSRRRRTDATSSSKPTTSTTPNARARFWERGQFPNASAPSSKKDTKTPSNAPASRFPRRYTASKSPSEGGYAKVFGFSERYIQVDERLREGPKAAR